MRKIKRAVLGLSGYILAAAFGLIVLVFRDQVGAFITANNAEIVFTLQWVTFIVYVALFGAALTAVLKRIFR